MTLGDEKPQVDFRAVVAAMVERLRSEGLTPGIDIGERAPQFVLPDASGGKVALAERLAAGPVVLSFYRGAWCPVCNTELSSLQAALPEMTARGASLVAVSPQAPDASQPFVERLGLGFDVLSDLDQEVTRSYRLQFELPVDLRDLYTQWGMSLEEHNADGSWNLPVPATFVIDQGGVVRARHVEPNYWERMPVEAILAALDAP